MSFRPKSHTGGKGRERREGGLPCRASADGPQNCSYVRTICSLLAAFVCYFLLLLLLVGTKGRRGNNLPSCSFSARPLPQTSEENQTARHENQNIRSKNIRLLFLCPLFASSSLAAGIAPKKEPDTDWLEFFSLFCPQSVSPFVLERRFFSLHRVLLHEQKEGGGFPKHDEKDILSLHKCHIGN